MPAGGRYRTWTFVVGERRRPDSLHVRQFLRGVMCQLADRNGNGRQVYRRTVHECRSISRRTLDKRRHARCYGLYNSVMNASSADELLPSRPMKETMSEIIGMSILGVFLVFLLGMAADSGDGGYLAMELAPEAGALVLEHIGWGFGAYIPILLGFYAIVIGGQLVAAPATAARTRRTLGFVAEAMASAFIPALVLIIVACIDDASLVGALLVIVPVAAVMFFLAIQLGGFIVFERALRLASAERSRDWAEARLATLRNRSRIPVWLVVTIHTLVGGAVGLGTDLALMRPSGSNGVLFLLFAMLALILGFASVNGVYTLRTARDRTSKVMAWVLPSVLYLMVLTLILELFSTSGVAAGGGVLAVVSLLVASTFFPRKRSNRILRNWTLHGAATGYAAKFVAKTYARNMREIRELRHPSESHHPASPRDRIMAAIYAFRGATAPTS